jgi:hypothetical protein
MFCIDKAFGFLYDQENLGMVADWIRNGKVVMYGVALEVELTLE